MNASKHLAGCSESRRSDAARSDVLCDLPAERNSATARFRGSTAPIVLTDEELVAITKRSRPTMQARILERLGIPFTIHPVDGVLLVARDAARSVLGGEEAANDAAPPVVNVDAIRRRANRGKAANAGR